MILVFSHTTSSRLEYITQFIFTELMQEPVQVTIDSAAFSSHEGIKVNYSNSLIPESTISIQPHSLLFEDGIKEQEIESFVSNNQPAFFKTNGGDWPFDIFAASFYLLSRYEEYLPYDKDMYGRYAHENSLAFKEKFLDKPLVNLWVVELAGYIKTKSSTFSRSRSGQPSTFNFIPTYDIDIAYSYRYKGLMRNLAGMIKSPSTVFKRLAVIAGNKRDPFDSYDFLEQLHQRYALNPVYFFLVPERNGVYDKNILPHKEAMWQLVKQITKKYSIGLHPSWQTADVPGLLVKEKEQLEAMGEQSIIRSRQHYIRFDLPATFRRLCAAGISDDYSMGYGSINGFRASVASSFSWYDLEKEETSTLRLHPFCYMEANSFYEQHFTAAQALDEMLYYYHTCKAVNGSFISIWHNHFLGTDSLYKGWKETYETFLLSGFKD
jgi:hypothetical protein